MNPRTTALVALVAAALGAFVYFYEIRGEEGRREAEEAQKHLFAAIEPGDVEIIGLTTSDGREAVLERRDDGWQLSAPLNAPADPEAAEAMAGALASMASESVIEDPQPPAVYGLADGAREIRFTAAGEARTIRFGDKTPVGANTYAATGSGDTVYAVPTFHAQSFEKSLDDLRERRILPFETASIRRVEASWPGGGVTVEKNGDDGWSMVQPFQGRADAETVRALLADLSYLRATGFVDDPPDDAEAGLSEPAFEVLLQGEEGEKPFNARITIGENLDGNTRLVRAGRPTLFRVAAERIDDLPRDVSAYRFRELARFPLNHARRMEIAFHDGEELVLQATRSDAGWEAQPRDFAPGKLATLVSELSHLKAHEVVADHMADAELAELGLAPPRAVYRVYGIPASGDAGAPEELLAEVYLGTLQGGDGIAARSASDGAVYRLPYELAEHVAVNREAFENRFAAAEADATGEPAAEEGLVPEVEAPTSEEAPPG